MSATEEGRRGLDEDAAGNKEDCYFKAHLLVKLIQADHKDASGNAAVR